ncbi:MAG: efflux RND transporter periplasmic adaptor subunit, partial [Burkholderiales bacterium]
APAALMKPGVVVTVLVAVAAAAVLGGRALAGKRVAAVVAERGELVQTVVSTGRVISPAKVEIGSLVVGTVAEIEVREGERVKRDQVLARLRDEEQRAAYEQARAALLEAEARLAQLAKLSGPVAEQNLRQAEANLQLAEEEYRRTKNLFDRGFFSQATLDKAERDLANARAARASAVAQSLTNQPKGADYALAVARREQAKAAADVARAKLDYTVIRAPADGIVLRRLVERGDVVQPGKLMYELAVAGDTQVVLNVDEKNLGLLAEGQRAEVVADAYPGKPFSAQVFYIAPGVDAQRGTVEVKLRVPEPPPFARADMTVSAEIVAGRHADTVILESAAIRDAASKAPWVLVARDGRAVRQPVTLGMRGAGRTEIVDGLTDGDFVIPATEAAVAEGARVRVDAAPQPKKPVVKGPDIFK